MGFFGKLFGSDKALEGIVTGVTKGLDALVYTDEEKANDAAKERSEARQMIVGWMAATQGQNLSRRLIALSITSVWLFGFVSSKIVAAIAIFSEDPDKLERLSTLLMDSSVEMNNAVMLILAFYFAAPHMGDIAKAVTGRFSNSVNKG